MIDPNYRGRGGTADIRERLGSTEIVTEVVAAKLNAVAATVEALEMAPDQDPGDLTLIFNNRLI